MAKVKIEFFKYTGKFYSSFEYESSIPEFEQSDISKLRKEAEKKKEFFRT